MNHYNMKILKSAISLLCLSLIEIVEVQKANFIFHVYESQHNFNGLPLKSDLIHQILHGMNKVIS